MKKAIVKIELEYVFRDHWSDEQIVEQLENKELPIEYRENSWEFIKIVKEEKMKSNHQMTEEQQRVKGYDKDTPLTEELCYYCEELIKDCVGFNKCPQLKEER